MISDVSETKLSGKKSSLGKTYNTNNEAKDKVYELNQQASKHVETGTVKCKF